MVNYVLLFLAVMVVLNSIAIFLVYLKACDADHYAKNAFNLAVRLYKPDGLEPMGDGNDKH